jgi:hypothetical protein
MLKPFKKEGKWGFCDEHNHAVIPPRYALASRFSQGLAAVAVPGPTSKAWGYIGESGEIAIAPRFQEAMDFHEDLAAVRPEPSEAGNAGWGYIDRNGSLVIPPLFDKVGEFSEGLAVIWKDGKAGYLDHEGRTAIEPRYVQADPFREGLARVRRGVLFRRPGGRQALGRRRLGLYGRRRPAGHPRRLRQGLSLPGRPGQGPGGDLSPREVRLHR